ncbi:hypothetical protein T492DRAFT_873845 [Pavlovales sp. CCMP2436]|nr:hypothetical protein T492DRAFT_873845 [Pavlovales sp. CCMP2436]
MCAQGLLVVLCGLAGAAARVPLVGYRAPLGTAYRAPRQSISAAAVGTVAESRAASPPPLTSTVIVGGGPAGLATAIMLAKHGWTDIHLIDRLAPPPAPDDTAIWSETARFYLLGLGGRGQLSLRSLGVWDDVAQVIARDRLVGALHRVVSTRYAHAVTLHYGCACADVEWDASAAGGPVGGAEAHEGKPVRTSVRTGLVIGADGTATQVAMAIAADSSDFQIIRYEVKK